MFESKGSQVKLCQSRPITLRCGTIMTLLSDSNLSLTPWPLKLSHPVPQSFSFLIAVHSLASASSRLTATPRLCVRRGHHRPASSPQGSGMCLSANTNSTE